MGDQYIFLTILNVAATLLLIFLLCRSTIISSYTKKYYILASILVILVTIGATVTAYLYGAAPKYRNLHICIDMVSFIASPLICVLLSISLGINVKFNKIILFIPAIVNAIAVLTTQSTHLFFYISEDNIYTRGPLYWTYIVSYLFGFLLFFIAIIQVSKVFRKGFDPFILCLIIFLVGGTSFQVIDSNIRTTWTCVTMGNLIYYIYYTEMLLTHDELTHLLNRRTYESRKLRYEEKNEACIILFDIDNFKRINDSNGYTAGDRVLSNTAKTLHNCFGNMGECFRIVGDRFCVLTTVTDQNTIEKTISEFISEIEAVNKKGLQLISISYGYSFYSKILCTFDDAVRKADEKLLECRQKIHPSTPQ